MTLEMGGDMKSISKNVMQMKFMQRTKKRLEDEEKRKEEEKLRQAYLGGNSSVATAVVGCASLQDEAPSSSVDSKEIVFIRRYDLLEDLAFGRMSFKGFNPEVEKLMKYYDQLKRGIEPEDDLLDEKDISDAEMAETFGRGLSSSAISKKFSKGNPQPPRGSRATEEVLGERGRKRRSGNYTDKNNRKRRSGDDSNGSPETQRPRREDCL
ncbi:hypothetical protein AB6A40_005746 [Gnathostoma spinigerum]|uniref:M-phase phosphoprotein 6 n=1 Tax=Gnathostoma spinigerum TaxID=75299 RepID=A0ABD6EQS3_9BILA